MKASSSTAEVSSGRVDRLWSDPERKKKETNAGQTSVDYDVRLLLPFYGFSTCYLYSFWGCGCLPWSCVLCLTLESNGFKRMIHSHLNDIALHSLTVHRRHVATRRQTFSSTLKLILFCNIYYLGAFDLNLWWTSWKKDIEDRSVLRKSPWTAM